MTQNERIFRVLLHPVFVGLYLLLIIASYLYFDEPLAIYFHQLDLRQKFYFLSVISLLGKWQIYVALLLALALGAEYFQADSLWRKRLWFLFLCVLIPNFICVLLKISLGRARPDLFFDSQLYGFYWFKLHRPYWSFPSGHTTTIISLAAGLTILFPRYLLVFFAVGIAIASTRVFLYHHYLSDVLTAFYLTLIEVGLMRCWLNKKKLLII